MSGLLERCARALCEQHIRTVRRWDTSAEAIERMMPASVDYSWPDFTDKARAVISTLAAEITDDMMAALFAAGDIASLHPIIKANLTALLATLTELRKATR